MVYEITVSTSPYNPNWALSYLQLIRLGVVGCLISLLPCIVCYLSYTYSPALQTTIIPSYLNLCPVTFVFLLIPLLITHIACTDLKPMKFDRYEYHTRYKAIDTLNEVNKIWSNYSC
jgi:hypothetical protein